MNINVLKNNIDKFLRGEIFLLGLYFTAAIIGYFIGLHWLNNPEFGQQVSLALEAVTFNDYEQIIIGSIGSWLLFFGAPIWLPQRFHTAIKQKLKLAYLVMNFVIMSIIFMAGISLGTAFLSLQVNEGNTLFFSVASLSILANAFGLRWTIRRSVDILRVKDKLIVMVLRASMSILGIICMMDAFGIPIFN